MVLVVVKNRVGNGKIIKMLHKNYEKKIPLVISGEGLLLPPPPTRLSPRYTVVEPIDVCKLLDRSAVTDEFLKSFSRLTE